LYLVRHAESTWNAEDRVQGQADPPLSEHGRLQAAQLAARFRDEGIAGVYASPLERARQTAEIIATKLDLPLRVDERLKEHDMGLFTGLVWTEIVVRFPEFAAAWMEQPFDMPGGEKHLAFRARAVSALQDIVTRHPSSRVVIVSHGGILGEYLSHVLGMATNRRHPFRFDNASVTLIEVGDVIPRLHRLNDTSHLLSIPTLAVSRADDEHGDNEDV
jgi:broad specificity phosphatase PhoE